MDGDDLAPAPPDPVTASLVLGVAVGVFGVSFGVLAVASGLTPAQACTMSLLVFTGASQFAAVGVIGSGGSTATALGSALLLAARNGAYGLALSGIVRGRLPTRLLGAQLVIDESTAMATAQRERPQQIRAFWFSGVAVFVLWNVGTFLGALGGEAIGDPERYGLDAAFPAGFVALAAPHLRSLPGRLAAVGGVAIALILVPVAPVGVPVLAASLAVLVGLRDPGHGEVAPLPGGPPTGAAPAAGSGPAPRDGAAAPAAADVGDEPGADEPEGDSSRTPSRPGVDERRAVENGPRARASVGEHPVVPNPAADGTGDEGPEDGTSP